MWVKGWREEIWSRLDRPWDVIIIGGGITGAGIMRLAAEVGLRVLLVEAGDFASGTSSRSSKLVHGGLRYLRQAQLGITFDSVHGRDVMLEQGQGLIEPLPFMFVSFQGDTVPMWQFGLGLAIYDILGLHWRHDRYDQDRLVKLLPCLNEASLVGGWAYHDAKTDDARLVLRLLREGVRRGGRALNYAPARQLIRTRNGRVHGVVITDEAPGAARTAEVLARVVINATGADADRLRAQVGRPERLRRLRGSHLVFTRQRFPLDWAISFAHSVDGRPVFALPWENVTLFGTTDVDHAVDDDSEPIIRSGEVDYLLDGLDHAFPELSLTEGDVQTTFSGLRAVIDTGQANPSKESRDHAIWQEDGLVTVAGGKLTTFPNIARDALAACRESLDTLINGRSVRVLDRPAPFVMPPDLAPEAAVRLAGRYGLDVGDLLEAAGPGDLAPLGDTHAHWAELRWAARSEGVVHLDDLLLRRVRLALMSPEGGIPRLPQIRAIVQEELGWDDDRWGREEAAYIALWRRAYSLKRQHAGGLQPVT